MCNTPLIVLTSIIVSSKPQKVMAEWRLRSKDLESSAGSRGAKPDWAVPQEDPQQPRNDEMRRFTTSQ